MIDSQFEVVKWNAQDYGFPLRLQFGMILYRGFNIGLMGCCIRLKAWFPYRCICRICRVCRTKKIHRTDITLWKPPVQMLNRKETTDTTFCTRWNEFYLSYEFFSYGRHDRYDRYNHMETRLKVEGHNEMNKTFKTGCGMSLILRVRYGMRQLHGIVI